MAGDRGRAGFRYGEHTADLAVHAWGDSPGEAISQAVLATAALVVDPGAVGPARRSWEYEVAATDWAGCLVQAVNEYLYLLDCEGALVAAVTTDNVPPVAGAQGPVGEACRVRVRIRGNSSAEMVPRPALDTPPKAATYYLASLAPAGPGNRWTAHLILDI